MTTITALLVVTVTVSTAILSLLAPRDKAVSRAIASAVILFAAIPTFGPPSLIAAIPVVESIALIGTALLRQRRPFRFTWGLFAIAGFVVAIGVAQIRSDSLPSNGLILAQVVCFILVAAACSSDSAKAGRQVFVTLMVLLPIEFVIASLEQARIIPAVWSRDQSAQYHNILLRINELAPFLAGRSMGTFAHPILLGFFAAIATTLCLIVAMRTRRVRYLAPAALGVLTLALSGTRSAAAATAIALVLYMMLTPGRMRSLRILVGATAIVLAYNTELLGNIFSAEVVTSASYLHRTLIISSVPNLLERDEFSVLFGSGAGSIEKLFSDGVMSGLPGFHFFDNQYVRLLALSGVLSLVLFACVAIRGLVRGNRASRVVLCVVLVMMTSFDSLTWGISYLFTIIAVSGAIPVPGADQKNTAAPAETRAESVRIRSEGRR